MPFHSKEFTIPSSLEGQLRCFFAVLPQYSIFYNILTNLLHPYFKPVCITQSLPACKVRDKYAQNCSKRMICQRIDIWILLKQTNIRCLSPTIRLIQALYTLHFSYTGCFWLVRICLCGCGKTTNMHICIHTYVRTYIHTYIHTYMYIHVHA